MPFSVVQDIRYEAVVLADNNSYSDPMIQSRIGLADDEIIGRLSGKFSMQTIFSLPAVPVQIHQLSIWLAVYKTLSAKHSLNRNEEQSTNINWYKTQADAMIARLKSGEELLTMPDGSLAILPRNTFAGSNTKAPSSFGMGNLGQPEDVQIERIDV